MNIYIAEVAGRDSISAVHSFIKNNKVDVIIPTIVYTGTEYGDLNIYDASIKYLFEYSKKNDIKMNETVYLYNEKLWNYICIRYQYHIFNAYSFYTPCIMCHFFVHLMRVSLYLKYGCKGIITGERYVHDNQIKANQQELTINCFNNLFEKYGIQLIQPLLAIKETDFIIDEISDYALLDKINNVKCILSNNLDLSCFTEKIFLKKLDKFLTNYVSVVGDYLLHCFVMEKTLDYDELDKIMKRCFHE